MTSNELLQLLQIGCAGGTSAIRCITKFQPIGLDKVAPPTYEGGTYAEEDRLIDGQVKKCFLLDSVQSVANRKELLLLQAREQGRLKLPLIEMEVAGHSVNSLTAPHRVHDAIFRDSLLDGKLFRESEVGKKLIASRPNNATGFFQYGPHVLLFGTWDSQAGGGINTAKVARSLTSEIVAIDAVRGVRTSSRLDPLGIKAIRGVIQKVDGPEQWKFIDPSGDSKKKTDVKGIRPSEINHGNVTPAITPPDGPGGITFREAVQTTVLSLAQLRHLRFPDNGAHRPERDIAGRVVIAALGLAAITLQHEDGYQLRSRCQLQPVDAPVFELLGKTTKDRKEFSLDVETALAALRQSVDAAAKLGLRWHDETIQLQPKPDLVKLVELSDRVTAVPEGE